MRGIDLMSDFSERVPYNIAEYPVYASKSGMNPSGEAQIACHWHDDFEFGYVLSGEILYHVNGDEIPVRAGQGIFINARQLHDNDAAGRGEYMCVLVHPAVLSADSYIRERYIAPVMDNLAFPCARLDPGVAWMNAILNAVEDIWRAFDDSSETLGLTVQNRAYGILEKLFENMPRTTLPPLRSDGQWPALLAMVGFIQRHFTEDIGLTEIARAGHLSKSACNAVFRRRLRQTPITFLTVYRLEKAKELLARPDLSVTEIALAVGFSGSSYFTETFRKHVGLTPSAWRKHP